MARLYSWIFSRGGWGGAKAKQIYDENIFFSRTQTFYEILGKVNYCPPPPICAIGLYRAEIAVLCFVLSDTVTTCRRNILQYSLVLIFRCAGFLLKNNLFCFVFQPMYRSGYNRFTPYWLYYIIRVWSYKIMCMYNVYDKITAYNLLVYIYIRASTYI